MAKKRLSPNRAFWELVAVFAVIVVGCVAVLFTMPLADLINMAKLGAGGMLVAGLVAWWLEAAPEAPASTLKEAEERARRGSMGAFSYWHPESGEHFDEAAYNSHRARADAGEYFER